MKLSHLGPAKPRRPLRLVFALGVAAFTAILLSLFQVNVARAQSPHLTPRLYWVNWLGDVFSAAPDGTSLQVIRRDRGGVNALVVAPQATDLYVSSTSEEGILRIDGSTLSETFTFTTSGNVSAMAYDELNQRIYWAERTDNLLWRADLDGENRELLTVGRSQITSIQVDPVGGWYYWNSGASGDVVRADVDSSYHEIFNYADELGSSWMNDLALDTAGGRLFAVDASLNAVVTIGVDGSGPRIVVNEGVAAPRSIAIDPVSERIYWSNSTRVIAGVADYVTSLPPELQELIPEYTYIPTEYDFYVMSAKLDGSDLRREFMPREVVPNGPFGGVGMPQRMAIVYTTIPEPSGVALAVLGIAAALSAHRHRRLGGT